MLSPGTRAPRQESCFEGSCRWPSISEPGRNRTARTWPQNPQIRPRSKVVPNGSVWLLVRECTCDLVRPDFSPGEPRRRARTCRLAEPRIRVRLLISRGVARAGESGRTQDQGRCLRWFAGAGFVIVWPSRIEAVLVAKGGKFHQAIGDFCSQE